jgi:hypothetical protein
MLRRSTGELDRPSRTAAGERDGADCKLPRPPKLIVPAAASRLACGRPSLG